MDEFQGQQEIVLKKHKHKSDLMPDWGPVITQKNKLWDNSFYLCDF